MFRLFQAFIVGGLLLAGAALMNVEPVGFADGFVFSLLALFFFCFSAYLAVFFAEKNACAEKNVNND